MFRRIALLAPLIATPAYAGGVDVEGWLARPGVRMVAVEFYASWCEPCQASVPKWRALHERYEREGLRLIVVASEDPKCGTTNPGWNPDALVCDDDGSIMRRFEVEAMPKAFLWSWDGKMLGAQLSVDQAESAIQAWTKRTPRARVEVKDVSRGARIGAPALEQLVRSKLGDHGKIHVVATAAERRALDAVVKESLKSRYDERSSCEVGSALAPNSLLDVYVTGRGGRLRLQLNLLDAQRGCLSHSSVERWNPLEPGISVAGAVSSLLDKIRGEIVYPWGKSRVRVERDDGRADRKRMKRIETAWENVRAFATDASASLDRRQRALDKFLREYPSGHPYVEDAKNLRERIAPKPLTRDDVTELAKSYYNYRSEWAGEYNLVRTMKIRIVPNGDSAARAHVEYYYQCAIQRCRGAPNGVDKRTFDFVREGTRWRVTKMGAHMSGSP
ncbi:MAG: thioredoxin domain-containing protein [Deltaproteobacteria bacterium]|jgi:thiol-disulfide isomerase/thioredoxin